MTAFKIQIARFDTFLFKVRDKIHEPYTGWRSLPVPVPIGAHRDDVGHARFSELLVEVLPQHDVSTWESGSASCN